MAQKFIKVVTPVTTDGQNLAYNDENQVLTKTTYLPATARRELESNTKNLPKQLQPKITEATEAEYNKSLGKAGDDTDTQTGTNTDLSQVNLGNANPNNVTDKTADVGVNAQQAGTTGTDGKADDGKGAGAKKA